MNLQALEVERLAETRSAFAGLEGDWTWLDNAGGSFVLREAIARVSDYMGEMPVQLGGSYPLSLQAAARQAEAAERLAGFINAADAREIVLGASSTALTWQVARALLPTLQADDEIVITNMDHEANRSPWLWLRAFGIKVRTWDIDSENFALSLSRLDELLNERTRLVCFSHCSNILGRIEPVEEITRRVHGRGARVFVDGVAFAPHRRMDMQKWNVDFYVCSLYKLFGPHIGLLYGKRDALLELGNINHEYLPNDALPYRMQPGGANYELAWGATAIVDYFGEWARATGSDPFADIARHESALLQPLLEILSTHPAITLYGSSDHDPKTRLPIVAFRHSYKSSAAIATALIERRFAVRHGHFHSRRLLEFLGVPVDDGVVRISLAHYNTAEEVSRLVMALREVLATE